MGKLKFWTGRNFSMSGINSGHHYLPTYQILMILDNVEFLPPIFYAMFWQPFWKWQTMSRIDSWNWKISTGRHFQNGHHNTAQIQHCPISTTFHMWVDYDVPNWFLTLNFNDIGQCWIFTPHFYAVFWQPFWKWQTSWNFWKCRIAPLMVTYHYVKFYVYRYVGR
jgi:hypothetical protein